MRRLRFVFLALGLAGLTACDGFKPNEVERDPLTRAMREQGSIFGESITIGGDGPAGAGGPGGIAVNGYLWRASLDTIAFFPMAQVDAHGGVIITEWYALPEAPNERYKLQVYILNRELRADGVRVSLFKQVQNSAGAWTDAPIAEGSAARIENAILTRARQLRIDSQAILN
ncbi:MAG: DUF3576 domain-containing protein [Alphaproteobacteria bacterium]|nr:DUF3576 domain-containing protein [Alphaproteobacteria bacterium]